MIDETVEEIQEMQTHSSSIVAIKATRAMRELLDRDYATVQEFKRGVQRNGDALQRANNSHASLQNALRDVCETVSEADFETVEEGKNLLDVAIEDEVDDIREGKRRAAENAAEYLDDGTTLFTHDFSSTVLDAIDLAVADGCSLSVYVMEAGPRHLGRKTARRLAEYDEVDVTLVADTAMGIALQEGDIDEVMTGMTCIVGNTFYNRVGTYPLAATANHAGVPVTVVGSGAKIIDSGFAFQNEYRPPAEVMREPADGFAIENPAYDATPVELLTQVVTDEGVREF